MVVEKASSMFDSTVRSPRNVVACLTITMVLLILMFNLGDVGSLGVPRMATSRRNIKTSRIHYLIPSTVSGLPVCASIASALVNRYPIPVIVGYKGQDEFDSGKAHIAKILAIKRYIDSLTDSQDDDLILVMDSFDVLAQVPIEVMIERYFEMTAKADQRLADQRGLTVEELHKKDMRQTILFGAGKICSPADARCHLVPYSGLPRYAYGPQTDANNIVNVDTRHLNSGTLIAPMGDFRKLIDDTQKLIEDTYDMTNPGRNKDQFYISTLYARQEYQRSLDLNGGVYPMEFPDDIMLKNLRLPKSKQGPNDTTDYHIFVDFDSTFTQTQCYNEPWMRVLKYNNYDLTASLVNDPYDEGRMHIRPFKIQMPSLLYRAMNRTFFSLPEGERLYMKPADWVRSLRFGTNIGTQIIYSFYHNTCSKEAFVKRYQSLWFYPLVRPLLRVAKKAIDDEVPLHPGIVDGRMWLPAWKYPINKNGDLSDEFGGIFTDFKDEPFISFTDLCHENFSQILSTQKHHQSLIIEENSAV